MQFNDSLPQAAKDRSEKTASVADSLLGLAAPAPAGAAMQVNECPGCHYTREQFNTTGQFGCPECYVTFLDGLTEVLQEAHGGATRHAGKVPAHYARTLARNAEASV